VAWEDAAALMCLYPGLSLDEAMSMTGRQKALFVKIYKQMNK
jgi:hypothetical protein